LRVRRPRAALCGAGLEQQCAQRTAAAPLMVSNQYVWCGAGAGHGQQRCRTNQRGQNLFQFQNSIPHKKLFTKFFIVNFFLTLRKLPLRPLWPWTTSARLTDYQEYCEIPL
jgi:hypothetical protein